MIQRLLRVYVQLLACEDNQEAEDLKMKIAPDAASLISQGDTIVFETTGMPELLSQRMLDIQQELRDKFKRVQNYRYDFVNRQSLINRKLIPFPSGLATKTRSQQ